MRIPSLTNQITPNMLIYASIAFVLIVLAIGILCIFVAKSADALSDAVGDECSGQTYEGEPQRG